MSGPTSTSAVGPTPRLKQTTVAGASEQVTAPPAETTPPHIIPPPTVTPSPALPVATITNADGSVSSLVIDEASLAGLPPVEYLQEKYSQLIVWLQKQPGSSAPQILDPTLQLMLEMEMVLATNNQATRKSFEHKLFHLPPSTPHKPYLLMIFVLRSLQIGAIKPKELPDLFAQILELDPQNADLHYLQYKAQMQLGNEVTAFSLLIKALRLSAGLPIEAKDYLIENWEAEVRFLNGLVPKERLLEIGSFFIFKANQAASAGVWDAAHSYFDAAITFLKKLDDESDPSLRLLLANVYIKSSDAYFAENKYLKAYNELELAARIYECAPQDDPIAQLALAEIYLKFLSINKKQPAREQYLRYNTVTCRTKLTATLVRAEKLAGDTPPLLEKTAELYLASGDLKKATELYRRLAQLVPENAIYHLRSADLALAQGEIAPAFAAYGQALRTAEANRELGVLGDIYLRLSLIRTNASRQLVDLQTGEPTALQSLLNFLVQAVLICLNPVGAIPGLLLKGLSALGDKKFSEEELGLIIEQSSQLEQRSLQAIDQTAIEHNDLNVYFSLYAQIAARTAAFTQALKELKENFGTEEKIKEYQQLSASIDQQARDLIRTVSSGTFARHIDQEFEQALESDDPDKIFLSLQQTFNAFRIFSQLIEAPGLPQNIRQIMYDESCQLYPRLAKLLERGIELAKEKKDPALALRLAQAAEEFFAHFPDTLRFEKKGLLNLTEKALSQCVAIAAEQKDEGTLVTIAAALYRTPHFSAKAIKELVKLAGEDPDKLKLLADFLLSLWVEGGENPSLSSQEIRTELGRELAKIYQKISRLPSTTLKEKIELARQLWIIGDLSEGYLGYMRLATDLKKERASRDNLGGFYYELGLMAFARGKKSAGEEWFQKALCDRSLPPELKKALQEQLESFRQERVPEGLSFSGGPLPGWRLWAATMLYQLWGGSATEAVQDLLFAEGEQGTVTIAPADGGEKVLFSGAKIEEIIIVGNQKTGSEVILQELRLAGVAPGERLETNLEKLRAQLTAAGQRLGTFEIADLHREGGRLIVVVREFSNWDIQLSGGASTYGFDGTVRFGYKNLFGRGVRAGAELDTQFWRNVGDLKRFNFVGGRLYYFDPTIAVIKERVPVSAGVVVEYTPRLNYSFGSVELMTGGKISFGFQLTRDSKFTISSRFYHVKESRFGGTYYEGSLQFNYELEKRDNPYFPNRGFYVSAGAEPGFYQTGSGGKFFFNSPVDFRFYQPLGLGFVLALRAAASFGYNLMGGGQYALGGIMNPYVRSAGGGVNSGSSIISGSAEIRAPLIDFNKIGDFSNKNPVKMQFYVFADSGFIPGNPFQYGVGGGVRIMLPVIGIVNVGYGYPGGLFIWFGDNGWN